MGRSDQVTRDLYERKGVRKDATTQMKEWLEVALWETREHKQQKKKKKA